MPDKSNIAEFDHDKLDRWFSGFIDQIKVDHFLMATQTAPEGVAKIYNAFIQGDEEAFMDISFQARQTSSMNFIMRLVIDYLKELSKRDKRPLKLALGLSDSKILVWAEINNDDESMEDALLIAEAEVNSKYHQYGFYINSTIVEKSDDLSVPSHFQTIIE